MKTACPTCGADVEFRYDDSFVRVCSYCRRAAPKAPAWMLAGACVAALTSLLIIIIIIALATA